MRYKEINAMMPEGWALRMKEKLDVKMRFALGRAQKLPFIPYTTKNGDWAPTDICWWTNGFWGAELWQMFLMTGDVRYRDGAVRAENMMDEALHNIRAFDHDAGFRWLIHSGVRYAVEKNEESFDRVLLSANLLAARLNPNGFIRAWNGEGHEGWAIIDCMMNLPLLYWASRQTGDPRFHLMAMRHADTAMNHFVRADGSCNHIVCFDPLTGEALDTPGGQGYANGSSWSRGQAWALYGFVLSFMMTGKRAYLDTAIKTADYFIAHVEPDFMPVCDFAAPKEPVVLDNAAGSIAACGLMELAKSLSGDKRYNEAACRLLLAMEAQCADWSETQPAIFTKCTEAYHGRRHITMNYADYFFIEAVNKLLGNDMLFWAPDMRLED